MTWLLEELFACPTNYSYLAILEKVFGHEFVIPLLPEYYPHPHEAKVQLEFLKNFKLELEALKQANLKDNWQERVPYMMLL